MKRTTGCARCPETSARTLSPRAHSRRRGASVVRFVSKWRENQLCFRGVEDEFEAAHRAAVDNADARQCLAVTLVNDARRTCGAGPGHRGNQGTKGSRILTL